MKVKLLRKVRAYARQLILVELVGFTTTDGEITGLSFTKGYSWAFEWMLCQRLDYYDDHAKIVSTVSRKAWEHGERDRWMAKLRKTKKGKVVK